MTKIHTAQSGASGTGRKDRPRRSVRGRFDPSKMMPLSEFAASHRARIEAQVAVSEPPPKWLLLGDEIRPLARIHSRGWVEWYLQRGMPVPGFETRAPIPRRVRDAVMRRDGLVCRICGGDVAAADVHLDHIVPWSKGGDDTPGNLRVTHSTCNVRRGNRAEVSR